MNIWQLALPIFITLSQILMAGVAINAFSLLLYASYFNLKDNVARTFVIILFCLVIIFSAEAIGSTLTQPSEIEFWLRVEWVGILILPAAYFHFSDALLSITGKPSRGRRRLLVRLLYILTAIMLLALPFPQFFNAVILEQQVPHLENTFVTILFTIYYLIIIVFSIYNFFRAYKRTRTPTSRRRMFYLVTAGLAPVLGSFPFMLFGSGFAGKHPLIFWITVAFTNVIVGALINVMAYSVSFYGVSWPDRVIKSRLFKWIMRGPVAAGFTLGIMTVINRAGNMFNFQYTGTVASIAMLLSFLIIQYGITLFRPLGERVLLFGDDRDDIEKLHTLENRMLTRNDLVQLLELQLAAICDSLQVSGAYLGTVQVQHKAIFVTIGANKLDETSLRENFQQAVRQNGSLSDIFQWGDDLIVALKRQINDNDEELVGILGITNTLYTQFDTERIVTLQRLADRIMSSLNDWLQMQASFESLQAIVPEDDWLLRLRGTGNIEADQLIAGSVNVETQEISNLVRDALTHYWGGPKFTKSPLLQLKVVRDAMDNNDNNAVQALRSILKEAIERTRPVGERRFTAEWIIYNILEMKFLEGRKVREIALKLAVSEADLYRKQRMAIDAVAESLREMEQNARENSPH